jgi:hypothetical protein
VGGGQSYTTAMLVWDEPRLSLTVESDISRSSNGMG